MSQFRWWNRQAGLVRGVHARPVGGSVYPGATVTAAAGGVGHCSVVAPAVMVTEQMWAGTRAALTTNSGVLDEQRRRCGRAEPPSAHWSAGEKPRRAGHAANTAHTDKTPGQSPPVSFRIPTGTAAR